MACCWRCDTSLPKLMMTQFIGWEVVKDETTIRLIPCHWGQVNRSPGTDLKCLAWLTHPISSLSHLSRQTPLVNTQAEYWQMQHNSHREQLLLKWHTAHQMVQKKLSVKWSNTSKQQCSVQKFLSFQYWTCRYTGSELGHRCGSRFLSINHTKLPANTMLTTN